MTTFSEHLEGILIAYGAVASELFDGTFDLGQVERDLLQPIVSAPKDGSLILVWAPGREGLSPMFSLCAYHPDAGFCIDEVREPTHWMPLPPGPKEEV